MANRLDLTTGSIPGQLLRLAGPILAGMLLFTLYIMIDLYFVGRLGPDAVAALSISGNVFFIHLGLSFIIGTGAMALIARAAGSGAYEQCSNIFHHTLVMALVVGVVTAVIGVFLAGPYIRFFGGTGTAFTWGVEYFRIYSVSVIFLLLIHVFGACYRGLGDTKTSMLIALQSLAMNIVLDPLLIFGFAGLPALGVKGAALASLISQIYGVGVYVFLVFIKQRHVHLVGRFKPDLAVVRQSLAIGIPSGLTYFLLTANLLINYRFVSAYGTEALAALGIGFRVVQAIYLPTVALSEAVAAMVGQNFGARDPARVQSTFWAGWRISMVVMLAGTLACWMFPAFFIRLFSSDPGVVAVGVVYLKIVSLSNAAVGVILLVSAGFQGLGRTWPTLVCALLDNLLFALAVFTLPQVFGWGISSVWWLKLAATLMETGLSSLWFTFIIKRIFK